MGGMGGGGRGGAGGAAGLDGAGLKDLTLESGGKEEGRGATLHSKIYNTGKSMTIAYIRVLVTG